MKMAGRGEGVSGACLTEKQWSQSQCKTLSQETKAGGDGGRPLMTSSGYTSTDAGVCTHTHIREREVGCANKCAWWQVPRGAHDRRVRRSKSHLAIERAGDHPRLRETLFKTKRTLSQVPTDRHQGSLCLLQGRRQPGCSWPQQGQEQI